MKKWAAFHTSSTEGDTFSGKSLRSIQPTAEHKSQDGRACRCGKVYSDTAFKLQLCTLGFSLHQAKSRFHFPLFSPSFGSCLLFGMWDTSINHF